MHTPNDSQLGTTPVSQLLIDERLGNDTKRLAASGEHGVGEDTHESDIPATEDECQSSLGQELPQLTSGVCVNGVAA
jgi:hypothetical protein